MAQTARNDLKAELGDTVGDFDLADLNPRNFVRKHLLDDIEPAASPTDASAAQAAAVAASIANSAGQPTPYDVDAT